MENPVLEIGDLLQRSMQKLRGQKEMQDKNLEHTSCSRSIPNSSK